MKRLLYYLRYDWPLHFIMVFTSWMPNNVPFLRFRGMLCRPFLGSCGPDLRLGRNITFYNASNIHFGSHVYVAMGCIFLALGDIVVGDRVMFGPNIVVSAANHTKVQGSFRYGPVERPPIKIGADTWIGANCSILGGAVIGSGCVIGSNAAVTRKEIPNNSFAAGVPAVVKKADQDMPVIPPLGF